MFSRVLKRTLLGEQRTWYRLVGIDKKMGAASVPIYEYRCTKCGNLFEDWTKSFDSPEEEACPECGGNAVRVVSRTSFKLVGSGWFATDYGKSDASSSDESQKKEDGAKETPKSGSGKTSEGSTGSSEAATSAAQ